ncbi:type IV secretory system conjugative DNA transfer family protein [Microbaculum marinisediminis]|uniref:Type IV secretory system conjugative DNA transfer family protein n=1 Tax=Microbaculum marinisediminis TaxID=2931392 RepID=A0AAW5QV63_9HYPH|nr:type IV secretory system conjugative DNA transfer family protein [Microbaculum sp. A6E488]MCT8970799.1 type IV secretory system conjugative DNA transfer family protein [Microbaculum sp. A6E488]
MFAGTANIGPVSDIGIFPGMFGMARPSNNKTGSPTGSLLVGVSFYALAAYWPELTGADPNAGDQFYLGFFKFIGAMAIFGGLVGYYNAWRRREQRKQAEAPSGTFGEAAFATLDECGQAGLLNPRGLYLGLLEGQPIFYSGKAHLLTVAPARQGKGINVVIPNLLHFQGSVFVTDPKGELAAVTAAHRAERLGQKVYVLNPWGLHGLPQHRCNPLQPLLDAANDPALLRGIADEAKALALQLLPEPEDQKNRYFREGARTILRAVMLHLATRGAPETCTLPEMWRVLSNTRRIGKLIDEMEESDALFGMVADLGQDLAYQIKDNPDQFADFRQGAVQALDIFDPVSWLGEAVSGSDVDFRELKDGKASVYLVIPQDRIATHGAWLGLLTRQAITAVARSSGKSEVLFLLDEFANMGKLSGLAESLTALPGLGVRVWAFVQELSEIIRLYGPHTTRTVISQAEVTQFFAVQDDQLARTLSMALGQRTVKARNYSLGRFDNDEIGESLGETGRPLMSPDQIRLMGEHEQLLFIKALPPLRAQRLPFWFIAPWASWAARNPVEGNYPVEMPLVRLKYRRKEKSNG